MKNGFLLLLLLGLFVACQSEQEEGSKTLSIDELKTIYSDTPTEENKNALKQAYLADTTGQYNLELTQLQLGDSEMAAAIETLKSELKASLTPDAALLLGDAYQAMGNKKAAQVTTLAFEQAFPNHPSKAKIPSTALPLDSLLEQYFQSTYNDSLNRMDLRASTAYIACGEAYALLLPNAEGAPNQLKQAGAVAESIRQPRRALDIYDWIVERYPNTREAEQALFKSAFIYENDLSNLEEAGVRYKRFLDQYPNSGLADDAKITLDNLGKDPAEMLKAIQERGQ